MSSSKVNYCWLDCDPGHDDAFAILLATHSPNIQLIGISTSAGNQTIEKTTRNAFNMLNIFGLTDSNGLKYPLIKGSSKPLMRPGVICDEIHGESGLETHCGFKFPDIETHVQKHVDQMNNHENDIHFTTQIYKYIKTSPQPVTIISTGPLTNTALLLINYPDCVKYIDRVVLMGGACGYGNTGPAAEFNIQVDPEAAHIVFESNLKIVMVPLEVTHTALVKEDILERISMLNTNFSKLMIELLLYFKSSYKDVFFMDDPPLHDPCAVAFIIDESLFDYREMRVDIETASPLSYGQTVCDIYGMSKKRKNAHVCLKMNVEKFWSLIIDAIEKVNQNSPINN